MKTVLKRIANWWNQNATKRWLLALDRGCICYMFTMFMAVVKDVAGTSGDITEFDVAALGLLLLFVTCYTPSYMFPGSDAPVDLRGQHDLDDGSVKDKEKEP